MKSRSGWMAIGMGGALTLATASGVAWGRAAAVEVAPPAAAQDRIAVYFSPEGQTIGALLATVEGARQSVRVAAYTFTDNRVADALIAARQRGVDVRVVLDRDQAGVGGGEMDRLVEAGVPVWIAPNADQRKMHHKFLVIDGRTIVTGSYNFTYAANDTNFENVVIIDGRAKLAEAFTAQHDGLMKISERRGG